MDWLRVRGERSWLTAILAGLLPGLGHWYRGLYNKALLICSSFVFHLALAYTLLHILVIEQPITIAFQLLVLPYHYFYAIFNSLSLDQSNSKRISYAKFTLSFCLIILSVVLIVPIHNWYYYKLQIIYYYPMLLLLGLTLYMLTHLKNRMNQKWMLGRLTGSMLTVLLTLLLLLNYYVPIQWQQWLYVIPIVCVMEAVALILIRYWRGIKFRFQFDWWGALVVLLCSLLTYFVLQYSDYPSKILQSFHAPSPKQEQLDLENGYRYELAPIKLPVEDYDSIELRHLNGYVKITQAAVEEMTIYSTLFVHTEDEEQAIEVKQHSYIDVSFDNGILLQSYLPLYNQHSYPRMNIEIVIPETMDLQDGMFVKLEHGALRMNNVMLKGKLTINTSSAAVNIYSLIGELDVNTKQGNLFLNNVDGSIQAQSRKGSIMLVNPKRQVQATALNGSLSVTSDQVGGNWDLAATVGNITAKLPQSGHYELAANVSFGKISGKGIKEDNVKQIELMNKARIYKIALYASNYIYLH